MDHSGRAFKLALRHIFWGLVAVLALLSAGVVAIFLGHLIAAGSSGSGALWRLSAIRPLSAEVQVRPGDALRVGETMVACFA